MNEVSDEATPGGSRTLGGVLAVLILLLVSVPLLELYVIVQVAGGLGAGQTIVLLLVVSVAGAWMVRRSGLGVLNQIRTRLAQGELPGNELVDGLLILLAGAFMLTPGFLTDALGLLLLFPPTRIAMRSVLVRRYSKRISVAGWSGGPSGPGGPRGPSGQDGQSGAGRSGPPLDAESFSDDDEPFA